MTLGHSSAEGGASIPGELVARLEAAPAGSRELDAAVCAALGHHPGFPDADYIVPWRVEADDEALVGYVGHPGDERRAWKRAPRLVTTSLDAALALAERVLGEAYALDLLRDTMELHEADGLSIKTLPLALCIAILKATTAPEAGAVGTTEGREPKIDTTREGADR